MNLVQCFSYLRSVEGAVCVCVMQGGIPGRMSGPGSP